MSGIAAVIHFDGRPADRAHVEALTTRMAHRGADGISHRVDGSVALGQCTFHTTEESFAAALPLADESGEVVLVLDGRVDNFEEMRRVLTERGHRLRSRADAELVLKAYLEWGKDCPVRLEGDFAALIWDGRVKKAFGFRDVMGERPFHYHWDGSTLVVASEVAAILELPWVPERPNKLMLAQYLSDTWYVDDQTLWEGIGRLRKAHWVSVGQGDVQTSCYWAPDPDAACPVKTQDEFVEYYRALLFDIVRRQSRSHLPVSFDVSGGLDSSAVFAVAAALEGQGRLMAPGMRGYTLKFEGVHEMNDLPYARAVAAHVDKEVIEVAPTIKPLEWYAERAELHREFPALPNNGVLMLGVWQQASTDGSRVHLGGLGGDQWVDTSTRSLYAAGVRQCDFKALFNSARADLGEFGALGVAHYIVRHGIAVNLPRQIKKLLRTVNDHSFGRQKTSKSHGLSEVLAEAQMHAQQPRAVRTHQLTHESLFQRIFASVATDHREREAVRQGVECRTPYNDRRIVQSAYSAKPSWLRQGEMTKLSHRQAMDDLLPKTVLQRTEKARIGHIYRDGMPRIVEYLQNATPLWSKLTGIPEEIFDLVILNENRTDEQAVALGWNHFLCKTIITSGTQ